LALYVPLNDVSLSGNNGGPVAWTWQFSWVREARWRWVSLDLRDLSTLSRNLSYRNPVTLMGYTLGPAVYPLPLSWDSVAGGEQGY